MAKQLHKMSQVDRAKNIGVCAYCGPVELGWRTVAGKRTPRCKNAVEAQRKSPGQRRPKWGDIKQPHGLTITEAQAWRTGKSCSICGKPCQVVDHCHSTGLRRGPLCQRCNMALGFMQDDPLLLEAGAQYLRNWRVLHAAGAAPDPT